MMSEDTELSKALVEGDSLKSELHDLIMESSMIQAKMLHLIELSTPEGKSRKFWNDLDIEILRCQMEITFDIHRDARIKFWNIERQLENLDLKLKREIPDAEKFGDLWPLFSAMCSGIHRLPDYDFPNPYRKKRSWR